MLVLPDVVRESLVNIITFVLKFASLTLIKYNENDDDDNDDSKDDNNKFSYQYEKRINIKYTYINQQYNYYKFRNNA